MILKGNIMKKISYERIYKSQEYLSPLGEIHHRALFGGYTLAVDDAVFAMVSDGELYLRACEKREILCKKCLLFFDVDEARPPGAAQLLSC
jgi:DNA transformation protein